MLSVPNRKIITMWLAMGVCAAPLHAETLSEAVQACTQEENSLKRLVCFDNLAKGLSGYENADVQFTRQSSNVPKVIPSESAPSPVVEVAKIEKEQQSDEEKVKQFGLPEKSEPKSYIEGDKLVAVIADITRKADYKYRITLTDGQIWDQTSAESKGLPKKGDTIEVEKGVFGGHFLKKQGSKKRIRVKRVQ